MALLSHQPHVDHAVKTLTEAVARFGISGLGISFNGGKDCTVMLHILKLVLLHQTSQLSPASVLTNYETSTCSNAVSLLPQIPCLYVTASDPFPEVDAFVDRMAKE
ncbi:hypothetical protein HDU98_000273 [Podochytrium sp. JEL0797]|nr:hypothetical protein HDU98_000273 [Podochytrium sp. JEL0797]